MITVTAATGRLGCLVIEELLHRGVPASRIVAAVRSPQKAADLAEREVQVREADYSRPETLAPAFAGTDKLLLISSEVFGQRFPHAKNAVRAAVDARVGLIVYTSFINTDTSHLVLAEEHKQTEAFIRESGLPYVLLRNGAYIEMYTSAPPCSRRDRRLGRGWQGLRRHARRPGRRGGGRPDRRGAHRPGL